MTEPDRADRPCPLCGEARSRPVHRLPGEIVIARCSGCGLLYRPSIPSDLKPLYGEEYFRFYDDWEGGARRDYVADQGRRIQKFDEHAAELERFKSPGRLLEAGCATGFFLEAARRRDWKVSGVDISAFAASYAGREFGIEVKVGTVESLEFPPASFDAVVALEYIEHVSDPLGTLRRLRSWLAADGVLMMSTPNAGAWSARRHPERFDGFLERRHFAYFTRETMRDLLARAGFAPIEIRTDNALVTTETLASAGVSQPEFWRALANRLAPGLKTYIRKTIGRWCGGASMLVYAVPAKGWK